MHRHQGFTLIELMSVVGVIGVLAAVATPAYQDYLARGQATEAIRLLAGAKAPLAEHYSNNGSWPASAGEVVGVVSGEFTATMELTAGAGTTEPEATLTATLKDSGLNRHLQGRSISLSTADGGRNWECRSVDVPGEYLPKSCR